MTGDRLRDEDGRRIPDEVEREAMRHAAERDGYIAPSVRDDTPRGMLCRAAGVEPRYWVDTEAVNAEVQRRQAAGDPAGGDVRDQLQIMHSHLNMIDLTDRNDLHAFQHRLNHEAAVAVMGPGSGIAMSGPDGRMVGDPEVIAMSREAEAIRARMAAQARARLDAEAIRFGGPYSIFGSVA